MVNDTLVSGGIHFTGLGSGTDFDTMIEQLIEVESYKKARLEIWKSDWEEKIIAFQELNTAMLSLESTMEGMDRPNEFLIKTAASSNESVISATAGADAVEGSHTISVTQLAQNHIIYNTTSFVADPAVDDITGGSSAVFSYTYDGETRALDITSGSSLNNLVSIINNDTHNPGVRAEVLKINDSEYRLKLVGLDLGATKEITIDAATTLAGYGPGSYTTSQPQQDAIFSVDGIGLTRSTNSISDAVEGLTLNLKDSPSSATITVATDTEAVKENVYEYVEKVNEIRALLMAMTKFDETTEEGSILTGNYGLQIISQNLKSITAGAGLGFDPDNDTYSVLSQLGITTDADEGSPTRGLLIIDNEKLDEALSNDIDAVAELFSAWYDGSSNSTDFTYANYVSGVTEPGSYAVEYTVSGGAVTGTIDGYAATYDSGTKQLTATEGPARGISIQILNTSDGSYSGDVFLKLGKAGELAKELDELTSSTDGTLHILEENYQDIIDNIDKKIEFEERRLANKEKELRLRFSRLEATLSEYTSIQRSLENQIAQLEG